MRKPKKVSSSLNHRWFYSYEKPLKFLSRRLSEKTHKGFISKHFKLSVDPTIITTAILANVYKCEAVFGITDCQKDKAKKAFVVEIF